MFMRGRLALILIAVLAFVLPTASAQTSPIVVGFEGYPEFTFAEDLGIDGITFESIVPPGQIGWVILSPASYPPFATLTGNVLDGWNPLRISFETMMDRFSFAYATPLYAPHVPIYVEGFLNGETVFVLSFFPDKMPNYFEGVAAGTNQGFDQLVIYSDNNLATISIDNLTVRPSKQAY